MGLLPRPHESVAATNSGESDAGQIFERCANSHIVSGARAVCLPQFLNTIGLRSMRQGGDTVMEPLAIVIGVAAAIREFFIPRYRPELHYMRGPGPAARRTGSFKQHALH